MFFTVLALGVA